VLLVLFLKLVEPIFSSEHQLDGLDLFFDEL